MGGKDHKLTGPTVCDFLFLLFLLFLLCAHFYSYVGIEGEGVVGSMALADQLRPDVRAVLARLPMKEIYMLSGDRQAVVHTVAREVGIGAECAVGGMSPFDKEEFIKELRARGRKVAMLGDGINDTLALSEADCGIALASGGVDAASSAADVVLLQNESRHSLFLQVEEGLDISRQCLAKIKQNLGWAVGYNLVSLPLATGALLPAFGLALDPALAGAMMAGSSLTVLGNSLSLAAVLKAPAASERDAPAQRQSSGI